MSKQLRRVLTILECLQASKTVTAPLLADLCGVSKRTIFRDLAELRNSGVNVLFDVKLQTLRLADRLASGRGMELIDALALAVAARELQQSSVDPVLSLLCQAAAAAVRCFPSQLKAEVAHLQPRITFSKASSGFPEPIDWRHPLLTALLKALQSQTKQRIHYRCAAGDIQVTLFSPHGLTMMDAGWSVFGHSTVHRQVVAINVRTLVKIEPTAYHYEFPPRRRKPKVQLTD